MNSPQYMLEIYLYKPGALYSKRRGSTLIGIRPRRWVNTSSGMTVVLLYKWILSMAMVGTWKKVTEQNTWKENISEITLYCHATKHFNNWKQCKAGIQTGLFTRESRRISTDKTGVTHSYHKKLLYHL